MSRTRPWFKFHPADWRSDPALRMCSLEARGLWVEMIALMHEATPYGHLLVAAQPPTDAQLAVLTGAPSDRISDLIGELETAGVFSRTRAGVIYSRRMTRDEKQSAIGRKSVQKRWAQAPENQAEKPPPNRGPDRYPCTKRPEARVQKEEEPYGSLSPPSSATALPIDEIAEAVRLWNETAAKHDLPKCLKVTKQRRAAIGARLREHGLDAWKAVLAAIGRSPHHTGQNERGWRADIDFAARESAFVRMLEQAQRKPASKLQRDLERMRRDGRVG